MPVLQVPTILLLAPLFIAGAILGLKRGMRAEAWTLAGLMLIWLVAVRAETVLLPLLERVIGAIQRAGQVLLSRDSSAPTFRFSEPQRPWVALVVVVALIALAYARGARMSSPEFGRGPARLLGPLLGVVNLVLMATILVGRLAAIRGANDSVAMLVPPFPGATVVLDVPSNPAMLLAQWPLLLALMVATGAIVLVLARTGRIGRPS